VAERLRPGDRVIVCPPTPGWVAAEEDPAAYDAIDYFARTVVEPTGAQIKLMLSGDMHHYAHYAGPERHLIHCGGGGAYLYATHKLPETIQVPRPESLARKATPTKEYALQATFPTKATSKRYAAGVFGRLPLRNPGFWILLGGLHTLFMLGVVDIIAHVRGTEQHLVTVPVAVLGAVILVSTTFFATLEVSRRKWKHWLLGIGHGVLHIGLGVAGSYAWAHLPFVHWPWPFPLLAAAVLYLPVSGFAAALLVSAYLLVASAFQVNLNELFAGQGIIDAKGFLRLHIGTDGGLTVYPVAVDRVSRQWTVRPEDAADRPWFQPVQPIAVKLAEPPVRL
jgi:hypothetical protein